MKRIHLIPYFFLILLIASCKPDKIENDFIPSDVIVPINTWTINCDTFHSALLNLDSDYLGTALNHQFQSYLIIDTDTNSCHHDSDLAAFANDANTNCTQINVTVKCCGCVFTLPPISKIEVEVDSATTKVMRYIDLITPVDAGEPLRFREIYP